MLDLWGNTGVGGGRIIVIISSFSVLLEMAI
jgi:hypothetical protein